MNEKIGGSFYQETGMETYLKAGMKVVIEAGTQITLKVGGNFVDISPAGVTIQGTMVLINSGGAAGVGTPGNLVPPADPDKAEIADHADPGSDAPSYKQQRRATPPALVPSYTQPTHKPNSPHNDKKTSWIEIELRDDDGDPVAGEKYRVTLTDGTTLAEGTTDDKGFARVGNIDPGNCKVTFPNLDGEAWDQK
jgi:type VI secretion system secreted protein VgrG